MTNEELLARIDLQEARWSDERTYKALRAVVELHKADLLTYSDGSGCECGSEYPCPTLKAIEGALND